MLGDGADQDADESAVPTRSQNQQVGFAGRVDQNPRGVPLNHLAGDYHRFLVRSERLPRGPDRQPCSGRRRPHPEPPRPRPELLLAEGELALNSPGSGPLTAGIQEETRRPCRSSPSSGDGPIPTPRERWSRATVLQPWPISMPRAIRPNRRRQRRSDHPAAHSEPSACSETGAVSAMTLVCSDLHTQSGRPASLAHVDHIRPARCLSPDEVTKSGPRRLIIR